jgi:hypothetical protein
LEFGISGEMSWRLERREYERERDGNRRDDDEA